MTLQEMQFPTGWFEDEVRQGFFVSSMMKRAWAGQLEVLREIDKACTALGLTWYMDGGTLLGAVRHKGFVPWDDDIDITMYRKDMEILRARGKEVLPHGYFIMDPRDLEEMHNDVFRIVSARNLKPDAAYIKKYHCPFSLGVDILVLDNYSDDEQYEEHRTAVHRSLMRCRQKQWEPDCLTQEEYEKELAYCKQETGVDLETQDDILNAICVQQVLVDSDYKDDASKRVKMFFGNGYMYDRAWFEKPVMLDFEGILMPAPCDYEKVLFSEYGNRKYIGRGGGAHNYPCYASQEETLRKQNGKHMLRYTYDAEDLHLERDESPSIKCRKLMDTIGKVQAEINVCGDNPTMREQLLIGEQKLLVALSGMLTPMFPHHQQISESFQAFGQAIFDVFSAWDENSIKRLETVYTVLREVIEESFSKRKEIVFLPCRAEWWPSMKKLWLYAEGLPNAHVHVCPISWYEEPDIGIAGQKHDESDMFPSEVIVAKRDAIDLASLHPNAIVVQVPYNNMAGFMMIDPENCTEQLKKWTDKLIYVPCFVPDTPGIDDGIAVKALENLIEQPAIMHADEVYVPTTRMRDIYIDTLVELGGEENRAYWEQKIKADDVAEISMKDTIFTV